MKILGLITEYNPFHNGHLYHLNASKEITGATHTIAVMSGNFLQRGEPAIVHKWERAKMAVKSGVDLVIEIPTSYACATAELFAYGSVSLLNKLGAVNCISFGSEIGNIDLLSEVVDVLTSCSHEFEEILKSHVNLGFTFPVARSMAIIKYFEEIKGYNAEKLISISDIIKNPNNILGIEYLKAIKNLKSSITPYTITRKSAHYHSKDITNTSIASATAIREHLFNNNALATLSSVLPSTTFNILSTGIQNDIAPIFSTDFQQSILSILRRSRLDDIKNVFDVVEGLENRIFQCSNKANTLIELYNCIKSKRYTMTRIQRILMHILLNINKDDIFQFNNNGGPQYARILAFNYKGREILQTLKSTSSIPIISNLKHYRPQNKTAEQMLNIDIRATNIYSLAFKNVQSIPGQLDYITSPYYEKN